jgi:hypothetical protein
LIHVRTSIVFEREIKKFHPNEVALVQDAIRKISADPDIARLKSYDLSDVFVHKFRGVGRQLLIAFSFTANHEIELLKIATHENFYRDLKREN